MIFVFSGTGNSYVVARRIADETGQELKNITLQVWNNRWSFDAEGKDVGFVFPVYYWGLPDQVKVLAEHIQVRNARHVWCVATCAGESGDACGMLGRAMSGRLDLDACYDVFMPNNAVFYEPGATEEEAKTILADADIRVGEIIESIKAGKSGDFTTMSCREGAEEMYAHYDEDRTTDKFRLDEGCIECRVCEDVCPSKAIRVYHRKPVWDEEKCSMCMGCLNMCPKKVIEFGDTTVGRQRYYHKEYHKKVLGIPLRY